MGQCDLVTDDPAATNGAPEHPVHRAMSVVGAVIAVLAKRAAELTEDNDHGVSPARSHRVGHGSKTAA